MSPPPLPRVCRCPHFRIFCSGQSITLTGVLHFGSRAYCGQKLALSTTGLFAGEETVVMETGTGYGPAETADGNTIDFATTAAQYVRHWSSRSDANSGIHFMEIDVYGCPVASTSG